MIVVDIKASLFNIIFNHFCRTSQLMI